MKWRNILQETRREHGKLIYHNKGVKIKTDNYSIANKRN